MIDVRNQLDRYAAPCRVEWHLACINNRWTKRALASAGFGFPNLEGDSLTFQRWKPVFSVAEIGGDLSAAAAAEFYENEKELKRQRTQDAENMRSKSISGANSISHDNASSGSEEFSKDLGDSKAYARTSTKVAVVQGLNRPLFHIDLTSALQSAIHNVEGRSETEVQGVVTKGV